MKTPLEPSKYYHIYNHANGKENLFENEGNYAFFLKRYANFITPIADTFAYCLMPNHFHLAIRIKNEDEIIKLSEGIAAEKFVSKQFANLFSSYSQAFNKQQDRKGSLFIPQFSRKYIDDEDYFRQLILYIHLNSVHHGFTKEIDSWKHSSFASFFSDKETNLKREEVIDWFGNKEDFLAAHQKELDEKLSLEFEK